MYLDEIGILIRETRKSKNITKESLAKQLGMSRASISGIENGTISEIGIRKIIALCDALGLELQAQKKAKHPTLQQLLKEQRDA